MRSFEKVVIIDGYQFKIEIVAKEASRPERWAVCQVIVRVVEQDEIIYRDEGLCYGQPVPIKYAFMKAAESARYALLKNAEFAKKINEEIAEFENWDGVINF
ncbi:hypothetical protein [Bacillus pumilus]|uniref:hypothetical protein n=1 Tax=Bacillus pumilus TaxID=1408 RepID=UPI003000186B